MYYDVIRTYYEVIRVYYGVIRMYYELMRLYYGVLVKTKIIILRAIQYVLKIHDIMSQCHRGRQRQ